MTGNRDAPGLGRVSENHVSSGLSDLFPAIPSKHPEQFRSCNAGQPKTQRLASILFIPDIALMGTT